MKKYWRITVWMLIILASVSACQDSAPEPQAEGGSELSLEIDSSAFEAGGNIPARYTCDGEDISPSLSWSEPPTGTESLTLICDDPDAPIGIWNHWVLFNLLPTARSLPENVPPDEIVAGVGVHGFNSWRRTGYGGPCPPKGSDHRYLFKLYALDTGLDLQAGASKQDVEKAMEGHILAEGQLVGRYGR
jgi:Raf kinase inhibitor-like YbhB/YbcL family protein